MLKLDFLNTTNKIVGIRIQRQREPDVDALVVNAPEWLSGFVGRDSKSPFEVGLDLVAVPPSAIPMAKSVAEAVRTVIIQYEEGRRGIKSPASLPYESTSH